jgi:hypothetical protein
MGGWQGGKMSLMLHEVLYKINIENYKKLIYSRLVVEVVAQVVLQS